MRSLFLLWSLVGLLATQWVSAVVYRDAELESVVIDDNPDDDLELEPADDVTTTQATVTGPNCVNANGIQGSCIKLEQCYPYLGRYQSQDFESFQLYDILKDAATPCEGDSNLVCCPDYNYGLPTRKPQFAGQTTSAPVLSNVTAEDAKNVDSTCGKHNYQEVHVVGGREANDKEFPYAVALLMNGRQFCGGSLISDQWVLTAAHCIANLKSFARVAVYAGDHDHTNSKDVPHQPRGVKRGFYNKGFSMRNLQHDIALLQLDKPVIINDRASPVCLSRDEPPYGGNGVLSGWGKTGKHKPPSSKLRTVQMRVIPHKECRDNYAKEPQAPPVTTGMVCAGEGSQGNPNLRDACNGDSGGPLVKFDQGKAYQFGIVSWGIGCGDKNGVYTRVDKYLAWIEKNSKKRS